MAGAALRAKVVAAALSRRASPTTEAAHEQPTSAREVPAAPSAADVSLPKPRFNLSWNPMRNAIPTAATSSAAPATPPPERDDNDDATSLLSSDGSEEESHREE
eukprot:1058640-Pleurochrysis_carterae.AAC.1